MRFRVAFVAVALLTLAPVATQAQKNELAAEGSGLVNASATNPSFGGGLQINYAHRLVGIPGVGLYVEVPFVAGFNNTGFSVRDLRVENVNSYFVTPGLKVKFAPGFFLSPYLAAGVGFAHFSSSTTNTSDTTFAADWGGGLDIKLVPIVGLRIEARDFYTGTPALVPLIGSVGNQNNVVVSGGIVFRF
jgi:opacity protein-like surface antigen